MHRGGRDPEVHLHVGFRGGASIKLRVIVDEGQVLALLLGEPIFHIGCVRVLYPGTSRRILKSAATPNIPEASHRAMCAATEPC